MIYLFLCCNRNAATYQEDVLLIQGNDNQTESDVIRTLTAEHRYYLTLARYSNNDLTAARNKLARLANRIKNYAYQLSENCLSVKGVLNV
ncbi:hypothetical protein EDC44_10923 [Cricetibacter osteomyelitidis]|uniref:Uncharacterized protein n=2 Tax=Cricetibacter osteomyelitidis TaxID=1521931 RepID=A0A4R2TKE5_9PAST|nr:hypothetical protein EDC44_10923 [Cricetibacter osteomyelitidis]